MEHVLEGYLVHWVLHSLNQRDMDVHVLDHLHKLCDMLICKARNEPLGARIVLYVPKRKSYMLWTRSIYMGQYRISIHMSRGGEAMG